MSLASNVAFVKEALGKQGKDFEQELDRVLQEGRRHTKASAVGYLMLQLEVERVQTDVTGWWIGPVTDVFKKTKYFLFEKATNKLHQINNYEKDHKPFTPIRLAKVDKCKNIRTDAEWLEASDFTQAHFEDKLNIEELTEALTPFDNIEENDYYLVTGTVKWVKQSPVFDPNSPGKPTSYKPIFEHTEKGDKFNLKLTITNTVNENIGISVNKYTHLLNAYPEEPPQDFSKWFANAKDEDRLGELETGLIGEKLVILGRGSKYMEKDGQKEPTKKPWLVVAEDGLLVNVEQWQKSGGQMKLPETKTTETTESETKTSSSSPSLVSPSPQPQPQKIVGNVSDEVLKFISSGKGGKEALIVELPKILGVEPQRIIDAIKDLAAKGEIYKEKSEYKATANLPG